MDLPVRVKVVEVGPRDGLQNEPTVVPVETRARFVEALTDAGVRHVEVGAFVSPRWVPQMARTADVFGWIERRPDTVYRALVPNLRGLADALAANVDEIAIFGAASEAFSQRNIHASIDESFARFEAVAERSLAAGVPVRGYVSTAFGCPYEGAVPLDRVVGVARRMYDLGCYEVVLSDTVGVATPLEVQRAIEATAAHVPLERLAVHFHDTYGQGLANVLAALQSGVTTVDAAVAALGGCPYAAGARGNIATEDLVYMLDGLGIEHGIDLHALVRAGRDLCRAIGRTPASRVALALGEESATQPARAFG